MGLMVEINLGGGHLRLNQPELAAARFAAAHHKLQTQFGVDRPAHGQRVFDCWDKPRPQRDNMPRQSRFSEN